MLSPNVLPAVGSMVRSETGPSFCMNGVVLAHVPATNERWSQAYALVLMNSGEMKRCYGLNDNPGIGWHAGSSILGYITEYPEMDYSNYD